MKRVKQSMQVIRKSFPVWLILLLIVTATAEAVETKKNWPAQIEQVLNNDPSLKGSLAGISIRSSKTGKILYQHLGDTRLRPASNLKLITATAALSVLGENYIFPTEILTDGKIKKGILQGNLYVKGKGDPTLLPKDFDQLANKLREKGIRKIKGDIIADDSWYDDVRFPVDLPWSDEQMSYGAPISALTVAPTTDYDTGTVVFELKPNKLNHGRAILKTTPKTHPFKVVNQTKTVPKDGETKIKFERSHTSNVVTIKGTISENNKTVKEWIAVKNPSEYTGTLLTKSLINKGIQITGKGRTGKTPGSAHILLEHRSMPLSQVLIPFMKLSNNGHAEILVKEMGKKVLGEGSWEKGLEVVDSQLPQFGILPEQLVLRDGSGVSHINLVTANQLSQLLFAVQKERWFPVFFHSLPEAGESDKMTGGTLRKRLREPDLKGKIHAKTGTISTVSSLSGYVRTKNGETVIFTILLNNLLDESKGKAIEDQLVRILAKS